MSSGDEEGRNSRRYLSPVQYCCCGQQQQRAAAAAALRPKKKNEYVRSDSPTDYDIVEQYRKGLTAVVDRCVYMSELLRPAGDMPVSYTHLTLPTKA